VTLTVAGVGQGLSSPAVAPSQECSGALGRPRYAKGHGFRSRCPGRRSVPVGLRCPGCLPVPLPDVVAGPGLDVELVRRADPRDVLLQAVGLPERLHGVERLPQLLVREQRVDLVVAGPTERGGRAGGALLRSEMVGLERPRVPDPLDAPATEFAGRHGWTDGCDEQESHGDRVDASPVDVPDLRVLRTSEWPLISGTLPIPGTLAWAVFVAAGNVSCSWIIVYTIGKNPNYKIYTAAIYHEVLV